MADLRALVVDNSPVVCQVLRYVLEAEGWTVDIARDGLEALDCIAGRRPDLIVTDLIMPRIDGGKLCAIVRNTPELRDIFLIVLSGVAMESAACSPGRDPGDPGSGPTSGSLHGACFSLCLCLCLSLSLCLS